MDTCRLGEPVGFEVAVGESDRIGIVMMARRQVEKASCKRSAHIDHQHAVVDALRIFFDDCKYAGWSRDLVFFHEQPQVCGVSILKADDRYVGRSAQGFASEIAIDGISAED